MKLVCLMIAATALICGARGDMPLSFTEALNNNGPKDSLSVKNYDTGALLTESYTDIEHLERNTKVNSWAYGADLSASKSNAANAAGPTVSPAGGLEASISSNVIGRAYVAWQSVDPTVSIRGRHPLIGRSVEELTGVFSIEKFILLWSDSRPGEISVDWLPCS